MQQFSLYKNVFIIYIFWTIVLIFVTMFNTKFQKYIQKCVCSGNLNFTNHTEYKQKIFLKRCIHNMKQGEKNNRSNKFSDDD